MAENELSYNQIMLLAEQWDLYDEPELTDKGAVFAAFGGKRLLRVAPIQETAFAYYLQKHLYSRGFARGLRFIPNKYGDAYGIWEQGGAYLCDYYEQSGFSVQSEYDLWRQAALLAEFHNASQGFFIPDAPLEAVSSPLEYAFWLTEQPPPPMTVHIMPIYQQLCETAQNVLEKAADTVTEELCEEAKHHGQVIQGRFNEQAICEHYGELLIVDYSTASYGLPAWELAYLLNRGLFLLGRDRGSIKGAIAEYEKRRRLTKAEKHLLNRLLCLPMEFVFAISDWQEQKINGEIFAETVLQEERILPIRQSLSLK